MNNMSILDEEIVFPALVRLGRSIIPTGIDFMSIWSAKPESGKTLSMKEPINADLIWIIDANAKFFRFQRIGSYRKTPHSLKKWINFERFRYAIASKENISFAELDLLIQHGKGQMKEVVRKVCKIHRADELLSKEVFLREIMNELESVLFDRFS